MATFDKEYSTQWKEEMFYLSEHGIKYSFVKTVDGIVTWKYKRNYELFQALADFYKEVYSK